MVLQWQYMWIQKIIHFVLPKPRQPLKEVIKTWKLYQDLTINLDLFIKAIEGDLRALIIEGEPSEGDLIKCWESIQKMYVDVFGGREVDSNIQYVNDYVELSVREQLGTMLLELGSRRLTPGIIQCMQGFGFPLPSNINDGNVNKALKVFKGYLNKEGLRLDKLAAMFEGEGQGVEPKKVGRADFVKTLTNVSIAFKMPPIQTSSITAEQFIEYARQLVDYQKQLEEQRNKLKS